MNTNRIITIAKDKASRFDFHASVECCGASSMWSEMSDMAQGATPNLNASFDIQAIEDAFSNGIRYAIGEAIAQMIYASPDMDGFNSENYMVKVTVK